MAKKLKYDNSDEVVVKYAINDSHGVEIDVTNLIEVAQGKCKIYVIDTTKVAPVNDTEAQQLLKEDGTNFISLVDFNTYVSGYTLANSLFNSNTFEILAPCNNPSIALRYIITEEKNVIKTPSFIKKGDVLLVIQTDVPDRWSRFDNLASNSAVSFVPLETNISGKESISNKVTSISSASTNTQYPSAKCVYDIVGDIEATLDAIRGA